MNLDAYVESTKLTKFFIESMRDEDFSKLREQLDALVNKFDVLSMKIAIEENFDIAQTLRHIECDLETYYRKEYKKLMGLFVPWGGAVFSFFDTYQLITNDDKYFIKSWKANTYMCLPVTKGHRNSHTITVKTPEEMRMEGDNNIPEGYANPFLCMFSFYCDLVEAVQKKYGALHPECPRKEVKD